MPIKKSKTCKNYEYSVNCKSIKKVDNIMAEVINSKLKKMSEMNQSDFLDILVKDGYLNKYL